MLDLKRIGPERGEELAALWTATFKRAYVDLHAPEDLDAYCTEHCTPEKARAMLESEAIVCKVAYRDGAPVGYVTVRNAPCPVDVLGVSVELKQLYLLPEEFGTGLGAALMEDAIETARALRATHVWLSVVNINQRASAFYRKHGFDYAGVGPTFNVGKDKVPSRIMTRAI